MTIFKLPDLGEGLPDAEINEWHVKVGDVVEVDQTMVSMETAKAVVEVPSPFAGKIVKLYGAVGDVIDTGSPLVEYESEQTQAVATSAGACHGATVAGNIEIGDTEITEAAAGITPKKKAAETVKVIPAVRALAAKLKVDLSQITPSGANGIITVDDVKQAAQGGTSAKTAPSEGYQPLRGVRRTMAIAMSKSHQEVVPVSIHDEADIHAWRDGNNITLRLIRAMVVGCQKEPALNAWYDGQAMARKLHDKVNLGLAMDSAEGLFVPVLKDVGHMESQMIRDQINRYKQQVADRSIPSDDLKDATITLSNFGMFAGQFANPIIVPPMVAILGAGRLNQKAVVVNGNVESHRMVPLSITFDHRGITGGEATRFLAAVIEDLQAAD